MDTLLKFLVFCTFCTFSAFGAPDFQSFCTKINDSDSMAGLDPDRSDGVWYGVKRNANPFEPEGIYCPMEIFYYEADGVYDVLYTNRDANGMHAITGVMSLTEDPAIAIVKHEEQYGGIEYLYKTIETDYDHWAIVYICGELPDKSVLEIYSVKSRFRIVEEQYVEYILNKLRECKVDPDTMIFYDNSDC